jgi:hypothetical protein
VIQISRPYQRRPIRFSELWSIDGWAVKVYGISAHGEAPPQALFDAAKTIARQRLPQPAVADDRYGAAFLIVHAGADGDYVLLDWWFGENMLQHHVYAGPVGEPDKLEYISPQGVGFCVWELYVFGFERQAWIDEVLAQPDQPSIQRYVQRQLNVDV